MMFATREYVRELCIMLTQNCLKKSLTWYTLPFAPHMDAFKSLDTLNKELDSI